MLYHPPQVLFITLPIVVSGMHIVKQIFGGIQIAICDHAAVSTGVMEI